MQKFLQGYLFMNSKAFKSVNILEKKIFSQNAPPLFFVKGSHSYRLVLKLPVTKDKPVFPNLLCPYLPRAGIVTDRHHWIQPLSLSFLNF